MEADIVSNNVKVGDKFSKRGEKRVGNTVLHIKTIYTVTRIEGDLITLEAPNAETLYFTRKDLATELCYFFSKV